MATSDTFEIKQHDTLPQMTLTLKDQNGAINLTTATSVKMIAGGPNAPGTFTGACTFVSKPAGTIMYTWVTGDTDHAGTYELEFEITWSGGGIQTVPSNAYDALIIWEDLG